MTEPRTSVAPEQVLNELMQRANTDPLLRAHIEAAVSAAAVKVERDRANRAEARLAELTATEDTEGDG